ncbi:PstS family phosphate ABC transporter substrate-binding protein [Halostella sp. JP-L12]|uniref:PstS family phosphate ABC transporter substrate-binding protein n=1 Tax=Halostella TaxID=1843185 RepID=UPI000EF836A9|nr:MULTISPECIES: PstS family phosphate ABC transporter substrate-binding protein [Halostella]NHN48150.1 PstS family phosphate ABC transporter substrate-binding protein [Halostella sp. JP-L12]
MTRDQKRRSDGVSRRKFIAAAGAAGAAAAAGCSGLANTGNASGGGASTLTADGSSTVFPITNTAASYWNSNPEAGDEDYWPTDWAEGEYGTDMRLADFFAEKYGYDATEERSNPPFRVSVALSHSGTGIEGVMEGRVDIGDSSAPAEDELSDADQDTLDNFVDHVVGVDGQPIVVSTEIADAGIEQITLDELKGIYEGDISNWSEIGGPDRDILALGRAEGSGTDTAFRSNVFGDPEHPIEPDQRFGQNQQLQQAISQADNAIAYIALAFVSEDTPAIGLEIDGTVYEYGENLGSQEYPLSRDLHAYTWEDTSKKEAAFLNFCLSDFGQEMFVAGNNYFKLPEDRLQSQREKVSADSYE